MLSETRRRVAGRRCGRGGRGSALGAAAGPSTSPTCRGPPDALTRVFFFGLEFVPLIATSLGALHKSFTAFLQLRDVRLDDDRLEQLFGGRRAFLARFVNSVSCAIARGTGYIACVAVERLMFAMLRRHHDPLPELQEQLAYRDRRPILYARPRQRPGAADHEAPVREAND